MSNDIHSKVQMPANSFFGYAIGSVYTLVVKDNQGTKVHRSAGAPVELIALLELRGFKRAFGGK